MNNKISAGWLTTDLRKEIKNVFEPRYKRNLKDDEVEKIAENLTNFMRDYLKYKFKKLN